LPTIDEWHQWQSVGDGLCVVCGGVSGHLEVFDFDAGGALWPVWQQQVKAELPQTWPRLVVQTTPSGGRHVIYRCSSAVSGNTRLALRLVGSKAITLIETRGEGGLFLCAPTEGYSLEQGSLTSLGVITAEEREILWANAVALNEYWPELAQPPRPGDVFNQRGDIRDLLRRHGWQLERPAGSDGNEHWRRPGKARGTSATLKDNIFYVFSTNASPFVAGRAYSPFAVYALLEHGGDWSRAAGCLAEQGFREGPVETDVLEKQVIFPDVNYGGVTLAELARQEHHIDYHIPGLLAQGQHCLVGGPHKSLKSLMAADLAIAVATGSPFLR
jgi:hypothetical protein